MDILLIFVVCFGLVSVGLCFFLLMPTVGQTLSVMWGAVMAEQMVAKARGVESGCELDHQDG